MASKFLKLLSNFFDIPVEKRTSNLSGKLEVSLHKGAYKLSTANAIYSFGKNYTSFSTAFKAIGIQHQKINDVLVLGFGLGSVVDLLEENTSIQKITAIDADEVVLSLAKKYLHSSLKDKVEFIRSDAEEFIAHAGKMYDLVVFDVFVDDETPAQFITGDFLTRMKTLIRKNGTLLFSKIELSRSNKIENDRFEMLFAKIFPDSFSIDADGNKVFTWINK